MKKISILAAVFCFCACISNAQVNILAARQATIGSTVTIRGIVTNAGELGAIRYVQDGTAGIALYSSSLAGTQRGDSIVATGTLTDYNNLLEVQPITTFNVPNTGNTLPAPQVITPVQLDEPVEGMLVRINNAAFQVTGTFAGNTSYNFTSNSQTGVVYVRAGSPLVGMAIPIGNVTLTGIVSQFYAQYQLLPRDANDIVSNSSISIISPLSQSSMSTSGFNIGWNTNITGSSYVLYGHTPSLELGAVNGAPGLSHTVTISGANPSDIFYVKAFSVSGTDTAFSNTQAFATISASAGWIKVYFNNTVDNSLSTGTNAVQLYQAVDDTMIAYINRAHHSVDLTMYQFDNTNISSVSAALNNAYNRGVHVRVIVDSSYLHPAIAQLDPAIPFVLSPIGGNYSIMHNKFIIIDANSPNPDEAILWTGSTNVSQQQINDDANNVIIFQDQSIAKGYTLEFNEMWGDTGLVPNPAVSRFGPYKTDNTPHEYRIGGIRVEQYFSPSDGVNSKILQAISTANTDIFVETMLITRNDIASALSAASASGIYTYALVDDMSTTTTWSTLQSSLPANHLIDYQPAFIMHNKYMVVDATDPLSDPIVLTGSHNWTSTADAKNDENTVIVHDSTIANIYYQEFVPRFTQSGGVLGIAVPQEHAPGLSAFPNPSQNSCNITFALAEAENVSLVLTDCSGRIISTNMIAAQTGTNRTEVDTTELPSGIYFVRLDGKGFSGVCRIVVSK